MSFTIIGPRAVRGTAYFLACVLTVAAICLDLPRSCMAQAPDQLQIRGARIDVRFEFIPSDRLRKLMMGRIALSAQAVAAYYQQYPVPAVEIRVGSHRGHGINSGHAFGFPRAHLFVSLGVDSTEPDFADDWITTHEMVHLAFPSVAEQHHWIEEGLATYVEPIARVRIGELSPQKVWGDMVDGLPNGLPQPGDRGLDFTHTWGRTYWGGALFCLLADVEIRKRTENRRGLEHALRGILSAGGNLESEWPLSRALTTADRAAGVTVLEDLYAKMRASPVAPDLDGLWRQLGVGRWAGTLVFDDSAPLAAIRKAITQPTGPEP
jgi:hypothetical protein